MTGREMIQEMKAKGYATQYTVDDFCEMFTDAQIKKMYDNFMNYYNKNK